jgi:CelD/BcsL family acetyltransferase involved in cellulose biosynthesis
MSYRTRIIDSVAEAARIAPAWRALAGLNGRPMDDPHWQCIAAKCVHPVRDRLSLLTVWDDEHLVALAPLMLSNGSGGTQYELIGTTILYEPAAILARDRAAAREIAAAVVALGHPIVLTRITPGEFTEAIAEHARWRGWLRWPPTSGSPYIDLSHGWAPYHQGLPSRIRNVLKRGERQLTKLGRLETRFTTLSPQAARATLLEAFEVESRSWKGRGGSAVLARSDLRDFFFNYVHEVAESGEAIVASLRLDDVPIAMQVANVSRRAYWQLKIGYDEAYSKHLPGLILLLQTINWSCEQGLDRYEFLGTCEPWIRDWTRDTHSYVTMMFYPFNGRGLARLTRDTATRVRQKLPRLLAAVRTRRTPPSAPTSA